MRLRQLRQRLRAEEARRNDRDAAERSGPNCCGSRPALDERALADDGADAELGDDIAVDLDIENAAEEQVQLVTRLALANERLPTFEPSPRHPLAAPQEHARELALDGFDYDRRLLATPW
jgi:hypothetical protein